MLQYEHEQRLRLEEMVEQLAKQHSSLEKQARKTLASVSVIDTSVGSKHSKCSFKFLLLVSRPKQEGFAYCKST